MCDTQKVEVPPSLNAMEGTGSEAGGRQGKEGKGRKGNKVEGLEASQFSSFHRACVSSVGCLFERRGQTRCSREYAALHLPSESLLRAQGCPSNAGRYQAWAMARLCTRLRSQRLRRGSSRVVSAPCRTTKMILNPKLNRPQPHSVHRLNSDCSSRAATGLQTCCAGRIGCGRS